MLIPSGPSNYFFTDLTCYGWWMMPVEYVWWTDPKSVVLCWAFQVTLAFCLTLVRLSGEESACNAGDLGLIPGLGRCPGEGNGNPLQYSCQDNPMDRGAWQATVHGVIRVRPNREGMCHENAWWLRITTENLIHWVVSLQQSPQGLLRIYSSLCFHSWF